MNSLEPPSPSAEWLQPGSSFLVRYGPPLLTEIEFLVKDASRRIAHGGIEVGGLLFGRIVSDGPRPWVDIAAFRSIECEHAFGPSFVLSDRDLTAMREQLVREGSDPELEGMQLIGWFIGHSRNDLRLSDHEAALFDTLFPRPGQLTLLVKPERFNPSRFAILARALDRSVKRDATGPGQSFELPVVKRKPEDEQEQAREPQKPAIPFAPPPFTFGEQDVESQYEVTRPDPAAKGVERLEAPRMTFSNPEPRTAHPAPVPVPASLPSAEEIRRRRMERTRSWTSEPVEFPDPSRDSGLEDRSRRQSFTNTIILGLVLLLGCGAGYWIYVQFFSPPLALEIENSPGGVLVTWAADQTADDADATLKVGEAAPRPLTSQEKAQGRAAIRVAGFDTRIELVVHHWWHDSKGIVRYVRAGLPNLR